ncbi:MAG: hemerythrin family protein [Chloroflexi bacterium]|nr:hemerythrin family protein [Chloroflexota bacterium]
MEKKMFDFDKEFKLGIEQVDREHVILVDMLNEVYALIGADQRDEARRYFNETLSSYVDEHFSNEEKFMESFQYPGLEEHRKVHENYRKSFNELKPQIDSFDDVSFRQALSDAFTWIIGHIGRTDRKYASHYLTQKS